MKEYAGDIWSIPYIKQSMQSRISKVRIDLWITDCRIIDRCDITDFYVIY